MEHEEYEFGHDKATNRSTKKPTGRMKQVRPAPHHCSVVMFEQTWGSTALGFGGVGGQAITSAYTVVIEGPRGDACVYFGGRLAYHIKRPNRQLYADQAEHAMREVAGARSRYETPTEQGGV